jgi:hypothetical protein
MQARPKRSWSMVLRLSVSYALVTIALLSLSGGLLYWRSKGSLEVDARNTLTDKISVMRQILVSDRTIERLSKKKYNGRALRAARVSITVG